MTPKEEFEEKLQAITGWCGCGLPEDAYILLEEVLQLLSDRYDIDHAHIRHVNNKLGQLLINDSIFYTYMYMLDTMGLTEHGGSVGGCWLTNKGKETLSLVKEYNAL